MKSGSSCLTKRNNHGQQQVNPDYVCDTMQHMLNYYETSPIDILHYVAYYK